MGEERRRDRVKERKRKKRKDESGVRLTFGVLQQEENCVFRDDELPQLHHMGHGVRHYCPLCASTVAALPQTLQ